MNNEGILHFLLSIAFAALFASAQLYHGFEAEELGLLALFGLTLDGPLMMPESMPITHLRSKKPRKVARIIHKEEPFFRPMSRSKMLSVNNKKPSRVVESKEYGHKYFSHRLPKFSRDAPQDSMEVTVKRKMEKGGGRNTRNAVKNLKLSEYEQIQRETRRLMNKLSKEKRSVAPMGMDDQPMWRWNSKASELDPFADLSSDRDPEQMVESLPARRKRRNALRRNIVGQSAIKVPERIQVPFYSSEAPSFPKHSPKFQRSKKRRGQPIESPSDPLESPIIRLAVAVALGALVTCGVYSIAALLCMIFPKFFGSDEDVGEDILGRPGRPVRYVPVPLIKETPINTSMI